MTVRLEMTLDEAKTLVAILNSGMSMGSRESLGLNDLAKTLEKGVGNWTLAPRPTEYLVGNFRLQSCNITKTIELSTIVDNT